MISADEIKVGDVLICNIPEEELNQYNQHYNNKEFNVVDIYHVFEPTDNSPVTILIVKGDEEMAISPKTWHWYTKKEK